MQLACIVLLFLLWQQNPYHISSPEPNVQSEELTKLNPPPNASHLVSFALLSSSARSPFLSLFFSLHHSVIKTHVNSCSLRGNFKWVAFTEPVCACLEAPPRCAAATSHKARRSVCAPQPFSQAPREERRRPEECL